METGLEDICCQLCLYGLAGELLQGQDECLHTGLDGMDWTLNKMSYLIYFLLIFSVCNILFLFFIIYLF